jgi:hypothetical protein
MFGTTALPPWVVPAGDPDLGLNPLSGLVRDAFRRHGGELLSTADVVGSYEVFEGNRQDVLDAAGRLRAAGADWLLAAESLPELPDPTIPGWIKGFHRPPLEPWAAYGEHSEAQVVQLLTAEWLLRAAELERLCQLAVDAGEDTIAHRGREYAQREQLRALADQDSPPQ